MILRILRPILIIRILPVSNVIRGFISGFLGVIIFVEVRLGLVITLEEEESVLFISFSI
jgi:hypothetical protein